MESACLGSRELAVDWFSPLSVNILGSVMSTIDGENQSVAGVRELGWALCFLNSPLALCMFSEKLFPAGTSPCKLANQI